MKRWIMTAAFAGILGVPAFGAEPARPGTVNYVEGAAYLNGNALNQNQVGGAAMNAGDQLTTNNGKAEVLLTPGIFLRVDSNSTVKMVAPDLGLTKVEVVHGRAAVEVDQIFKENNVQIVDDGVITQLVKTGYYEFDADQPQALVFKGRAEVFMGDNRWQSVKSHHAVSLVADAPEKPYGFDADGAGDQLYNWSKLRSQYLAEANNQIADQYAYEPGFYPGWYWNPYAWDYTFIGASPFWSPFGWGFNPWGGWGGWGFYGRPIYRRGYFGHGYRGGYAMPPQHGRAGEFHGGSGFHGGAVGGFHGGGHR